MNPMSERLILVVLIILIIDIYGFQALKTARWRLPEPLQRIIFILYWMITGVSLGIVFIRMFLDQLMTNNPVMMYIIGVMFALAGAKIAIMVVLLSEDVIRIIKWVGRKKSPAPQQKGQAISRSAFLSRFAILLGGIPFVSLTAGMFSGAYNFKKYFISLTLENLPDSFKGLKIVQISDIHAGSFTQKTPLSDVVKLINAEEPDLIFFTGDLVNFRSSEMESYMDIFKGLKAKEGIYSILGNHDYGDYTIWPDEQTKRENMEGMVKAHRELGWQLLRNENRVISKGADKLGIIGVENWSIKPRFHNYGNLEAACKGSESCPVKLLLSHDPTHWDAEVTTRFPDINVTFAGHTHGMQLGVETGDFKWSPVKYFYKHWAGLYEKKGQLLYVNRGLGFIGYPGRIGIMPEITIFDLNKG